jgi:TatD DNase family protein
MLIDSHCHLASHRFDALELPALLDRARVAGVRRLVTLATSLEDLEANLIIARDPFVHACIGIHPCDVHHAPDDAVDRIAGHAEDERVCAIGETGLDYYHPAPEGWDDVAFRGRQRAFLRRHFELAGECGLNVVIHTRDQSGQQSFEDALAIYQEFSGNVRAVFHCFIGTWENARRVLDLGGLVSFGGVSTFKNAHGIRETIASCPPGSFLLETDAPYLAPEPHRGKRNEPSYVRFTATSIAAQRSETEDQLLTHTGAAAESFFRFRSGGK